MKKILIFLSLISMLILISCGGGASSATDIVITGSSSVSPLMFKLAAKFEELNPDYTVTVETSDSTIGVQDTINGNNNIGMASRNLKEDELTSLDSYLLCQDGIVIIANKDSEITQISEEELYNLYMNNTAIDLSKYDNIPLPDKDVWGVVMRKDSPLAKKDYVELDDLKNIPLINSRQAMRKTSTRNEFIEWFQGEFEKCL